ncbi:hypothetical protein PUN4_1040019 [Paraburkholderia unamae]|nr:hypothetical protein PUN4_1040019 [Paraburkholderia unamae]
MRRHCGAATRLRCVRDAAVGAVRAVQRGDLGLRGLDRFGIVCVVAIADAVTHLLELHELGAHLGAGDGRLRERSSGSNESGKGGGSGNGLDQGLHGTTSIGFFAVWVRRYAHVTDERSLGFGKFRVNP